MKRALSHRHSYLSHNRSHVPASALLAVLVFVAAGLLYLLLHAHPYAPEYARHGALATVFLALVARPVRSRLITKASAAKTVKRQRRFELAHSPRTAAESGGRRILHLYLPIKSSRFRPGYHRIAVLGSGRDLAMRRSERLIAIYGRLCTGVKIMTVDEGPASASEGRISSPAGAHHAKHEPLYKVLGSHLTTVVVEQSVSSAKRCLDILLSVFFAILLSPLILAIVLCVKVSSPGPVLYGHTRIGRNGKKFRMWKFRSMYMHGDELFEKCMKSDPALREEWLQNRKLRRDPRVTTLGRILRKTSLDELPQLWNVLAGDMSLVGPRPIVDAEVPLYADHFCAYKHVRPGVTGLWQVSGRNHTSYKQRVLLDRAYAESWSVWLDCKILWRTWHVVVKGDGAY